MAKLDEKEGTQGLAPGTLVDGRYKVVRFIGSGGNGHVHEVEHVLTGRRLALKSLHDDTSYGRLEQEARATSLMKNGHAVKITDMGLNPGAGPYLVMDLLEGQSLRSLLDDTGQLPLELTVNIALQVCECLAEAHQHGIIHRDLKPDNVFLCASGTAGSTAGQYDVKVLDFGVVKIAQDGPIPNSSLTRTGSTVGTPFYMSLEQLRNSSAVDPRADIYALGVVLYESLSGRKPFQAETIGDLVYALCSGPPTHLGRLRPDLPPAVGDVVMRSLASNRDDRQATMAELAQDLLPYGDPVFGLWLRGGDKRHGSTPAPPATTALKPAGVPRPVSSPASAPRPEAPREHATGTTPRRPDAARVEAPRPAGGADTGEARRNDKPPRPPSPLEGGDRDTPTEMYIKKRHGDLMPAPEAGQPGDDPHPLDDSTTGSPDVPAPPARPHLDAPTGDRDTPTRAMEAVPMQGPAAVESASRPQFHASHTVPMPSRPPAMGPAPVEPRSQFPPNPFAPRGNGNQGGAVSPLVSTGAHPFKPAWQQKLDSALGAVGGSLERTGRGLLHRFRATSQRVQMVIVVSAASLLAALVVLLVYLFTGA
jgi:serine/threonine-protein kinase